MVEGLVGGTTREQVNNRQERVQETLHVEGQLCFKHACCAN